MFTGIIEELGKIQQITSNRINIACSNILKDTKMGDSIAVNGVCLTVSDIYSEGFLADVSPETMAVTSLNSLKTDDYVNLERALPANGRFGGHIVSGHIDGKGKFISAVKNGNFYEITIELEPDQIKYAVKKGSISINGISLTIADITTSRIKLAIIPHTYENTNLKHMKNGDFVNIETDIIAKYIEKFLSTSDNKSRIDIGFLQENGFM